MRQTTRRIVRFFCFTLSLAVLANIAQAQTLTVLYRLGPVNDGIYPYSGLISDQHGNLYGSASGGIENCGGSCGVIFKLSSHGTGWIYAPLYYFTGASDGYNVPAPLTLAPDGTLYGVTSRGGNSACFDGCGTIFHLTPQPNLCPTVSCPWRKTTVYEFTGENDGEYPMGQLTFDAAGNLYGTAFAAAENNPYYGSVFELTPSGSGWTFNVLYDFPGGDLGGPTSGVVFDGQGNLWGYQELGGAFACGSPIDGDPCGGLYELSPSASGWTATNQFAFNASTGGGPSGLLVADASGNFYGTLDNAGPGGSGGVFQFVPSTGAFNLIYSDTGDPAEFAGPYGGVVMDPAGNLYAADEADGPYHCAPFGCGFVFKLTPENNGWYFTNLHNFTGGSDGGIPVGPVTLNAADSVFGVNFLNIIWEITQ